MNPNASRLSARRKLLVGASLALSLASGHAAEYWLKTGTTTVADVPMWGYASCTDGSFGDGTTTGTCGPVTVPGPALTVPPSDASLTVHLRNTLPVPTSLVIPGQTTPMSPVWVEPAMVKGAPNPAAGLTYPGMRPAGNLTAVVRSFTTEAATGHDASYTWASVRPGTYLYHSGTQPQVQVQMGLYGSVTKDAAEGSVAYRREGTDIAYSNQVTLLYSEVDPALHQAVANGTYGTTGPTSTLEYAPKFFLINGVSYPDGTLDPVATVPAGQNTLLRLLNAGLKTHVPTVNGQFWKMIAEDGNAYPFPAFPRQQYTAFLPAGKTLDVLLVPSNTSTTDTVRYAIYDSRQYDTTDGAPGGGMLAYIAVTPAGAAAPVFDSSPVLAGTVGVPYAYAAHATDPNGDAVSYALNAPAPAGMTVVSGTGQVAWTPTAAGTYPVSVRASDGTLFSDQSFSIVVAAAAPANNPPTARNDSYTAISHPSGSGLNQVVAAPGVLGNDTDPDGNALHTTASVTGTVTLRADGGFTLAPTPAGTVTFTYVARDTSDAPSGTATATINVIANRAPTAMADAFTVSRCTSRLSGKTCRTGSGFYTPASLNLVSNDTDPDVTTIDAANQLPLAVARVRSQTSGGNTGSVTSITTSAGATVTVSGGSITYVPQYNFSGTDTFQYRVKDKLGLESGAWASVTVTVQ